jgi:cyclopropane-fatty-acyl-phospholipid synthase
MTFRTRAAHILKIADLELNGSRPFDPQVRDESVYKDVLIWGSLGLGDAYVSGKWDCSQLDEFFNRALSAKLEHRAGLLGDAILKFRDKFLNLQSIRRALQVAEHHYDLGNALYEPMLGESMGYSSGYYRNGAETLADAQMAKFDLVCTKLKLAPGMKLLEIGCGWGTFAAHAAKKYGVTVVAVTVSKEQLAFAKERCKGLPVEFYFGDYRTLPEEYRGTFDRVVSIEMIEAVGAKNLATYMKVAHDMLKKGGLFLIQAIIGTGMQDVWLSTRIFPNGVLPSLSGIVRASEHLFRVTDLESFGTDYDTTLMAWSDNFRKHWNDIRNTKDEKGKVVFDEAFYRMWQYYLLICAGAFRSKKIDVCQILLSKS